MMDSIWGDVPTWLGLAGAIVAFLIGRAEYRKAQEWKRAEFVAAEAKQFFIDEEIATALLLIDRRFSPARVIR